MSSSPVESETIGVATGKLGMWWFLASEVTIFGGIIASYALLRLHHPDWSVAAKQTLMPAGLTNTLILLTSSLTAVLAYAAANRNDTKRSVKFLVATLLLGLGFLGIKAFEYAHEIKAGHVPSENLFWSFYFFMTALHALHVLVGLVFIAFLITAIEQQKKRVEYFGLYWHLVDIVWIFLFPLLYLGG